MKLSDYVFKFVARIGVKHVFLLPGGGCMHLVDSLGRNKSLKYISCLHEQVAAIAAGAYAQYTGNIGVALVTTGPGGLNALTGTAAAWLDSIPVLYISGQVKRSDMAGDTGLRMLGYQEINIVSLAKYLTKYAVTVTEPSEIRYHLEKAIYLALNGRKGPVWIDIPLDVQNAQIDESSLKSFVPQELKVSDDNKKNIGLLNTQIREIINLLNCSHRPVILAGAGIKAAKAEKCFRKLVKKLGIPVLLTWKMADFFDDSDSLYCGRPGSIGQRGANFIQQNSDLLIIIGARLDFGQIGYSYANFARFAKKIVIDIDSAEIKKLKFKVDIALCCDAGVFIEKFLSLLNNLRIKDHSAWLFRCRQWHKKYPIILEQHWEQKDYVSTYALIDILSKEMSAKDILVPGSSGACAEISLQAFRVKKGQRIINMPALGAMGFGLPCALGVAIAAPSHRVICINGDGGFQLNIQDMETIARLKLNIKFFVLNNLGYGSIKTMQRNYFNGNYVASDPSSGLTFPDLMKVAKTYNFLSFKIKNNSEIKEKVKKILFSSGPVLCEVMVHPEEPTMPKLVSEIKPDGTIVSKPLEDLWPFLDRKEFYENMIVEPLEE